MTAAAKPTPDITHLTVKAGKIALLDAVLGGIFPLEPPPTPKGRYALSKVAGHTGPASVQFQKERLALLEKHAKKGDDGKPVSEVVQTAQGPGMRFDMGRGLGVETPEYRAELATIEDEDILLVGCRMITHAELGKCPITVQQERVLIDTGLLEDKEPDE